VVFELLPRLWVSLWVGSGQGDPGVVGNTLMGLVMVAAAAGLLYLGARLLGTHGGAGIRAGIFVGLVLLLLVVLLTPWASLWIEPWTFQSRWFSPATGAALTVVAGVIFLLLALRLYTRKGTQNFIQRLEAGGWFHATSYKGNQGQRVRRGTILGILLLV